MNASLKYIPAVEPYLKRIGLVDRIDDVITKAAIVSHPRGNRRYHHWIFDIQNGKVVQITDLRASPPVVKIASSSEFIVWEQCECVDNLTADKNCNVCGGRGEVRITRRLPRGK